MPDYKTYGFEVYNFKVTASPDSLWITFVYVALDLLLGVLQYYLLIILKWSDFSYHFPFGSQELT